MDIKDKTEGILMAYGLSGIDLKYATSDILSLFSVSKSVICEELDKNNKCRNKCLTRCVNGGKFWK